MPYISGAVEGSTDEAVLRRLVIDGGAVVHRIQVQSGKQNLRRALPGYNNAAQGDPWVVLVDLDRDYTCAAAMVEAWLPAPHRFMRFRVVVPQMESWLLADADRFASFFSIRRGLIPDTPDALSDAKATLIELIARSRRDAIRQDMLPRASSGRRVGPAYSSRLIAFVTHPSGWRSEAAALRSPSLAGCLLRLDELIATAP